MYDDGRGVSQDAAKAVRWYRRAAAQGHAIAQYVLGLRYHAGEGIPRDHVRAHMWFNLAAATRGEAIKYRDYVAALMTPEQIAEAQRLAREWTPR